MHGSSPQRERLRQLLQERNTSPGREAEIDSLIRAEFERRRAIMVVDMAGFSRLTERYGIIHYLAMIEHMTGLAEPLIVEEGGAVVKQEADNLFAVFESVQQAVRAAQRIFRALDTVDELLPEDRRLYVGMGIGYGKLLLIGDHDLYGGEMNLASKLGEDLAQREILLTAAARKQLAADFRCRELRYSISGLDLVAYRVEAIAGPC